MTVKLTKLSELKDATHPNNIPIGDVHEGPFVAYPVVGEAFWLGTFWRTSVVKEILTANTFRTMNSIYLWEII